VVQPKPKHRQRRDVEGADDHERSWLRQRKLRDEAECRRKADERKAAGKTCALLIG